MKYTTTIIWNKYELNLMNNLIESIKKQISTMRKLDNISIIINYDFIKETYNMLIHTKTVAIFIELLHIIELWQRSNEA